MMPANQSRRYVALDGLRGIAAVLVVFYHLQVSNHFTHNLFFRNGYLAVDLFFLLSGFVISSSYSHRIKSMPDAMRFIGLRFFRVYPMHLATLLVLLGLEFLKLYSQSSGIITASDRPAFTGPNSWASFIANLGLVQGLGIFNYLSWNAPSWSISCEFAAYLVFALTAAGGLFRSKILILLLSLAGLGGFCFVAFTHGDLNSTYDLGIVRCLAGFFIGACIFQTTQDSRFPKLSQTFISSGQLTLVLLFFLIAGTISDAKIVAVVPVFIGWVLLFQSDTGILARVLTTPAVQYLGKISYSVYMVHYVFLYVEAIVLKRIFGIPSLFDSTMHVPVFQTDRWTGDFILAASLIGIVVISGITFRLIETPSRIWGREMVFGWSSRARTLQQES
ncbi:acyltransferase [Bradyrhizobium sp. CCGUVB23]|uniref:acyltransferase family protein n=1 Tax=Bradyrhizobium sp. CCGUVB23 TaxID=2949630 RepID=UPI0020B3A004|nr:acyltransferase [Bradyrhizobium sp. CCGUVB23]MCP3460070.1 acyltransferase [Bradyrhizobium sp. CCGUVB23]